LTEIAYERRRNRRKEEAGSYEKLDETSCDSSDSGDDHDGLAISTVAATSHGRVYHKAAGTLDLSKKSIEFIETSLFSKCSPPIRTLDYYHNKINHIPANKFITLQNLQELWLEKNIITTIDQAAFNRLGQLKHLYIGKNGIDSLPSGVFSGLRNLKTLSLHNNNLTAIDPNWFVDLESLQTLDLAFNKIESIPANSFHYLEQLRELDLANNEIEAIEEASFNGLQSLAIIRLSTNNIREIPPRTFYQLKRLRALYLHFNDIQTICDDSFLGLEKSLKKLWIKENRIRRLTVEPFIELQSLETLNVGFSDPSFFACLAELKEMIID
jgi:Leucine-rich repeat (LRR) protein